MIEENAYLDKSLSFDIDADEESQSEGSSGSSSSAGGKESNAAFSEKCDSQRSRENIPKEKEVHISIVDEMPQQERHSSNSDSIRESPK